MRSIDLEPAWTYDFAEAIGDRELVTASVGPDDDPILLAVNRDDLMIAHGRDETYGASFALSQARMPYAATIIHGIDSDSVVSYDLPEVTVAHPHIQPLPGSRILVVGGRCWHLGQGIGEENAILYRSDGSIDRRMVFGDGIQDVQVSRNGDIWVSYFDEGVFGNYGWSRPIGEDGLLCFNGEGSIVWRFQAPAGFGQICDCYALNVARNAVWACYYTDFPFVKIAADRKVDAWANEIRGASAIAVDGGRVLLWGGYASHHTRCILQNISDDRLISPVNVNLILHDGGISSARVVIGRGSVLHVMVGSVWYQFDVRHIPW